MDKDEVAAEKAVESAPVREKGLNELKGELRRLTLKLEKCQLKFIQLNQQEEVLRRQEFLLKEQAHDLNKNISAERTKLDDVRRRTEENVEEFVGEINRALEKNKHMVEDGGGGDGGRKRERRRTYDERRERIFKLRGEMAALSVFQEYQECVMDEIRKVKQMAKGANMEH